MTHTSGLRYAVFDPKTAAWLERTYPGGSQFAPLDMPLSSEPGEAWAYGMSMEWAGHITERVSGLSLGEYIEKYILDPLGIKDATFQIETRDDLRARLAGLHAHTGEAFAEIPYPEPLMKPQYESGGGGMFASPRAYLAVLSAVLNGGVSPITGKRILKTETVDEMFLPQTLDVPDQGALGSGFLPTAMPAFSRPIPMGSKKAWTLSHMTSLVEEHGKAAGSGEWYGLANCYWTIDRQKGVAAIAFSNTLPFGCELQRKWS